MTPPNEQLVRISELAKLSGVPSPTIKHYMREGLLPGPARRTSRNMSYYDPSLAERVRTIKNLQQSHFLPLRMIGEVLEPAPSPHLRKDLDSETKNRLGGIGSAIRAGIGDARKRRARRQPGQKRTRAEIVATKHITSAELNELARLDLAKPTRSGRGAAHYEGVDLDLIEVILETRAKGMGELFPMAMLPPYVERIQKLVQMELELFRQRVIEGASLPVGSLNDVARDATQLAERMISAIRAKMVLAELDKLAGAEIPVRPRNKRTTGAKARDARGQLASAGKAFGKAFGKGSKKAADEPANKSTRTSSKVSAPRGNRRSAEKKTKTRKTS